MKPHIEALLSVDPRELSAAERAEIDLALADEPEDLLTAIAVWADRDLIDLADGGRDPVGVVPARRKSTPKGWRIRRFFIGIAAAAAVLAALVSANSDRLGNASEVVPARVELLSTLLEM